MSKTPTQLKQINDHRDSVENRNNITKLISKQRSHLIIRIGRIGSINLYEITDHELEILSRGILSGIYLNFAILLFSTASSFLIALLTTNVPSIHAFIVFVVVAVVGYTIGVVLLLLWWFSRKSTLSTLETIRKRIPMND